ncbi:LysE family translocator [Enterovibrio norvegicus]|uniref:Lysine transporter LysE n=1 Tax=Enterovibrio norvegicus TaxID=188144 RepID=A0A2N7L3C2_9GAMM|nr:LysE family translocator [Enterovibrio norvegicus]PMN74168.1 lysine transporter LysE [Enterovibrio norvegicus]PMN87380.1 lysine transporter LysE [Enterovibrio norvegicus]
MVSLEFLITCFVVVLIPGTGVLYTVASGLMMGSRASLMAAIGCTVGIVPAMLASVMGLAIVMHTSALAFQFVKYAGVAYLLFLAWQMWRSSNALSFDESQSEDNQKSLWRIAVRGCLVNILNPKLTIFFLAFLPQFVPASVANPGLNMLVLGAIFMAMTFVVFLAYGLLATSIRHLVIHSEKKMDWMQRIFAGSFAALGLKLALTERQ